MRYLVLKDYPMSNKFVYPCYRLNPNLREACVFHQPFGGIADVCDAEFFEVLTTTVNMVFQQTIQSTGGDKAVFGHFVSIYYTFANTLPLSQEEKGSIGVFWERYLPLSVLR